VNFRTTSFSKTLTENRLGSLFDAAPGQIKQVEVEEWAKERCPREWGRLEEMGVNTTDSGMRYFNIDRDVEP